jgi:hypothetical protein
VFVRASIRDTVSAASFATHTVEPDAASSIGPPPVLIAARTHPVSGSNLLTVPSP